MGPIKFPFEAVCIGGPYDGQEFICIYPFLEIMDPLSMELVEQGKSPKLWTVHRYEYRENWTPDRKWATWEHAGCRRVDA